MRSRRPSTERLFDKFLEPTPERKALQVDPLVEAEYPLDRGLEAMEHAARPGVRKVLLRA